MSHKSPYDYSYEEEWDDPALQNVDDNIGIPEARDYDADLGVVDFSEDSTNDILSIEELLEDFEETIACFDVEILSLKTKVVDLRKECELSEKFSCWADTLESSLVQGKKSYQVAIEAIQAELPNDEKSMFNALFCDELTLLPQETIQEIREENLKIKEKLARKEQKLHTALQQKEDAIQECIEVLAGYQGDEIENTAKELYCSSEPEMMVNKVLHNMHFNYVMTELKENYQAIKGCWTANIIAEKQENNSERGYSL